MCTVAAGSGRRHQPSFVRLAMVEPGLLLLLVLRMRHPWSTSSVQGTQAAAARASICLAAAAERPAGANCAPGGVADRDLVAM